MTNSYVGESPIFYQHPNHSGEVTSAADGAQTVADNVIDEANLKVSNSPVNGYYLQAQSGNTGGLTWAAVSGGGGSWEKVASSTGTTSANTYWDISNYTSVRATGFVQSMSSSDHSIWGLTTAQNTTSGVATEGGASQWSWAFSIAFAATTDNTHDGFRNFSASAGFTAGAFMTLEINGLDQTNVFYRVQSTRTMNGIFAVGSGFTTSGSSTWYLTNIGSVKNYSIIGFG